jgi:hypothetical protein
MFNMKLALKNLEKNKVIHAQLSMENLFVNHIRVRPTTIVCPISVRMELVALVLKIRSVHLGLLVQLKVLVMKRFLVKLGLTVRPTFA